MNTAIVLATHGVPPTDYPAKRVGLLLALEYAGGVVERVGFLREWRDALDRQVRAWPRTPQNDPYKAGAETLAARIAAHTHCPVYVGYNEFCEPTISEAIDRAISAGAAKVIVATTMLTPGGEHSEREIRQTVEDAQKRHPTVGVVYAWPYDLERVAELFAEQIGKFV